MPTTEKDAPDVLTVEEVQKRLRLSRNAVYESISRKEIPSLRLGRRILIPRLAFERMLENAGKAAA